MMKYYADITLLPDTEISLGFIWQKLFQQVHLALVENKTGDDNSVIALSFPAYDSATYPLGNKLRLFAPTQEQLDQADFSTYLNRLSDYIHCTTAREVPSSAHQHARFKRVQCTTNIGRLARRRSKRKQEPLEQALAHYKDFNDQHSKLPYINMTSLSQGGTFRLFIKRDILERPETGQYNCYGLSNTATTPWF